MSALNDIHRRPLQPSSIILPGRAQGQECGRTRYVTRGGRAEIRCTSTSYVAMACMRGEVASCERCNGVYALVKVFKPLDRITFDVKFGDVPFAGVNR